MGLKLNKIKMEKEKETTMLSLKLDFDLVSRFKATCKAHGFFMTGVLSKMIESFLTDYEDKKPEE